MKQEIFIYKSEENKLLKWKHFTRGFYIWETLTLSSWEFWWDFRNLTFSWENFAARKICMLISFTT
jgi:hypothetical protein